MGTRWRSGLRHCTTSRKVAGSIPYVIIVIFHWYNPSGRTMATGVESASNKNEYKEYFLVGKGGRCVGLPTLPTLCAQLSWNLWASNSWNPQGLSGPVMGLIYLSFFTVLQMAVCGRHVHISV
jgi:hypothetical protein